MYIHCYICIYIYMYIYIYIHTRMYPNTYFDAYIRIYHYTYIYIYTYIHTYIICKWSSECVHIYIEFHAGPASLVANCQPPANGICGVTETDREKLTE